MPRVPDRSRSGQAMAEFVVGLVALLAGLIGILAVSMLSKADTESFEEAHERAVRKSLQTGFAETFRPVGDVRPGTDGIALTKDDESVAGSLESVRSRIAGSAFGPDSEALPELRNGALEDLASGVRLSEAFALRRGEATRTAELPPAAGALFGAPAEVEERNEVWMPETGGLQ